MKTKFIRVDTRKCAACWKCVEICPDHVFGKVILFKHRHTHIDHADACKGCKKCVQSCPNGAIIYTYIPGKRVPRELLIKPHNDQGDIVLGGRSANVGTDDIEQGFTDAL